MDCPEKRAFVGCPLHLPSFCAPVGRRDFLKRASALAAGVPLAAGATGSALAAEEVAPPASPATAAGKVLFRLRAQLRLRRRGLRRPSFHIPRIERT